MDILYLVDRLENLIAGSRRMPLVNQIMIKESDILNIVDQLRTTIPDEIKVARRIIQEKERILAQAQADASTLLARAQEEREQAIKREGLLQAAGERSQEIMRGAQVQAEKLKDDADAYVAETPRPGAEDSLEDSYDEFEQPEEVPSPSRPVPRRASLAADTMGGPSYQHGSISPNQLSILPGENRLP